MKRWPRKNDPESIDARQKALGLSDGVTKIDLSPFVAAQEMLTGAAVIPVSVVGPLQIELGEYELEEPFGRVSETGRSANEVFVPLPHTEGGLSPGRSRRVAVRGGASRGRVRGLPNVRAPGPNHQSILFRLQVDGGGRAACAVPRRARRGDEALAVGAPRRHDLAVRKAARGRDSRHRADVSRHVGLHDRGRL